MAIVVKKGQRPAVFLDKAGVYHVEGVFIWNFVPDFLDISPHTGLVSPVIIDGVEQRNLTFKNDKLWLSTSRKKDSQARNTLDLRVYRLITDSSPLLIDTRIEMNVSGESREVLLGWYLPLKQTPFMMQSPLPIKLEKDGRLRVQIHHQLLLRIRCQWNF